MDLLQEALLTKLVIQLLLTSVGIMMVRKLQEVAGLMVLL